jgi:hypothetical protein
MALLLEDLVGQQSVGVDALLHGHLEAAQHDGDKTAGAGAADHVEVLTGLGRCVGIDGGHEPAEDHQR